MSAKIIHLASAANVNSAWNVYAAMCRAEALEPALANDRDFFELRAKKHEQFQRLFRMRG